MNERQRALVTEVAAAWMRERHCASCGSKAWALLGGEHNVAYFPLALNGVANPNEGIPILPVACTVCGFVVAFNPSVVEVAEQPDAPASAQDAPLA